MAIDLGLTNRILRTLSAHKNLVKS